MKYPPDVMPMPLPGAAPLHRWIDSLGATGAALCALHCALLPVALVLVPAIGTGWLGSLAFEIAYALFATALAIGSLWQGYRAHRVAHAWAFVVPGLALIWLGLLYPALHHSRWPHALAMAGGGLLIAVGHLVNLRLLRAAGHGPHCAHQH